MTRAATKRTREALELLVRLGIPKAQQNERSALTLLALATVEPGTAWKDATAPLRRITEMMDWMREKYRVQYAPNTRETVRRQTIHQFVQHGLVVENPDHPTRPINSPKWCYQLTPHALSTIASFGQKAFYGELERFLKNATPGALSARHRDLPRETVTLPKGGRTHLSAGGQNALIRSIVEEFTPRFIRSPHVLLLGDAASKGLIDNAKALSALGIVLPPRGKSPDLLIHDKRRNWLIVVEAVTSHGPIDQKRRNELTDLLAASSAGLVFVTAFPDRKSFAKFQAVIAWETEVWIAAEPDHLIHYNGERFLGPYSS
jgi:adenine-specific DNA-methyltransferase